MVGPRTEIELLKSQLCLEARRLSCGPPFTRLAKGICGAPRPPTSSPENSPRFSKSPLPWFNEREQEPTRAFSRPHSSTRSPRREEPFCEVALPQHPDEIPDSMSGSVSSEAGFCKIWLPHALPSYRKLIGTADAMSGSSRRSSALGHRVQGSVCSRRSPCRSSPSSEELEDCSGAKSPATRREAIRQRLQGLRSGRVLQAAGSDAMLSVDVASAWDTLV